MALARARFHVGDAALTALDQGNPLLLFAKQLGEIDLTQAGGFALGADQFYQCGVLIGTDDLHAGH